MENVSCKPGQITDIMKHFLTFFIFLSTTILFGQHGVKMKFYNKTGHDILDFSFMDTKVALIKNNDSTSILFLDSIPINDNVPHVFPNGTIKNISLKQNPKYHTDDKTPFVKTGTFYCNIRLSTKGVGDQQLWLSRH